MDFINIDDAPLIGEPAELRLKSTNLLKTTTNFNKFIEIKEETDYENNLEIISSESADSSGITTVVDDDTNTDDVINSSNILIGLDFDTSNVMSTKTGEIYFLNDNGLFIITCSYCIEKFLKMGDFRDHIMKIHLYLSEDLIITTTTTTTADGVGSVPAITTTPSSTTTADVFNDQQDSDENQISIGSSSSRTTIAIDHNQLTQPLPPDIIEENSSPSVIYGIPDTVDITGPLEQNEILLPNYTEEIIETAVDNDLETFPSLINSKIETTNEQNPAEEINISRTTTTTTKIEIIEMIKCGKVKQLKAHLFRMPNLHYQCPICNHETTRFDFMLSHFKAVHMINDFGDKFECQYCQQKFSRKSAFNTHVKTHTHPFKCQFCPFEFSNKSKLIYHQRFHLGERRFKCSECDERFVHEKERELHERLSHETVNSDVLHLRDVWQCNICGKYFRSQRSLLQHRKTKKNCVYSCELCDKRFFNDTDKLNHQTECQG